MFSNNLRDLEGEWYLSPTPLALPWKLLLAGSGTMADSSKLLLIILPLCVLGNLRVNFFFSSELCIMYTVWSQPLYLLQPDSVSTARPKALETGTVFPTNLRDILRKLKIVFNFQVF